MTKIVFVLAAATSRWRKASMFRSGGTARIATIGIVGGMTIESASAQGVFPSAHDAAVVAW